MFKRLFGLFYKREINFEYPPDSTKNFSLSLEKPNSIVAEQTNEMWRPFVFSVSEVPAETLCNQLEEIRKFCTKNNYRFYLFPLVNLFHKCNCIEIEIDLHQGENEMLDILLFLNEKDEVISFSFGKRDKNSPNYLEKEEINNFHLVVDKIKKSKP